MIFVLTKDLNILGKIDQYTSLSFTRNYSKIGEFQLVLNNTKYIDILKKDNLIILGKDTKKVGIINYINIKLDENGKENVTIKGVTLGIILSQRITEPLGETDRIESNVESVMHYYVNRNIINPSNPKRKIDLLISSDDKKLGDVIKYESRYKNLLEEIETIADKNDMGWEVYIDFQQKKWIYNIFNGRDLSLDQDENPPVVFSTDFGNIDSQEFTDHNLNHKNVGYVAGKGEGEEREIIEVGDASGFDRKEIFIEPRQSNDEYIDLKVLGEDELDHQYEELINFEAEILSNKVFTYEKDFNLGDIVTIKSKKWDVIVNTRIISVTEVYEPTGFKLFASFGNKIPTIVDKLKQELNTMDALRRK